MWLRGKVGEEELLDPQEVRAGRAAAGVTETEGLSLEERRER